MNTVPKTGGKTADAPVVVAHVSHGDVTDRVESVPDSPFNRRMIQGHELRKGHAADVRHVSADGVLWHKVYLCCGEDIPETVTSWEDAVPAPSATYRERREAKAERLHEWAGKREAKAESAFDAAHNLADAIPFGQPILVGHHSEGRARRDQDRITGSMRRGVENDRKASSMEARSVGIKAQLDRSIYSDDADAVEKLQERIAELEAERDRIKAYNATCRKGERDVDLLTEAEQKDLVTIAKFSAYQMGKGGAFPGYKLTNLNGNIARNRKRLEQLTGATS